MKILSLIMLLIFIFGCEDQDRGRTGPTRAATAIYCREVGKVGEFAYVDVMGNIINQAGLRFDIIGANFEADYYYGGGMDSVPCDGIQGIICTGITGDGGLELGLELAGVDVRTVAYEVGAPHRRKRLFILAYRYRIGSSELGYSEYDGLYGSWIKLWRMANGPKPEY